MLDDARVSLADRGERLIVASRTTFDSRLLAAAIEAGAEIRPERVTAIERQRDGAFAITAGGTRHAATTVIGADGANSLVRRRVATAFRRDQLSLATGFYAHGVTSDEIVIEFASDPPGYLWSFPRPDHLAIGICAQADGPCTPALLRSQAAAWIQRLGLAAPSQLQSYSWPIPSLAAADFERLDLAAPGWLLVGDAAGLVDPITREGIYFALRSATCAADALSAGSKAVEQYIDRVRGEIIDELIRAARLKARFFTPRFTRLLLDALAASSRVRAVMADLIAGTQSYRGLRTRLAGTFEIGLAWRLLTS
jgi:flavin-dependent dehydrogenase